MDNDLLSILDNFKNQKVLVIGEAILNSIVRGKADRLSIEAPVPVVDVQACQLYPGGAANAAVNLHRLGADTALISVIGQDPEGDSLLAILMEEGIDVSGIIRDPQRSTLLKRRVYAETQLLVRYDQGSSQPIPLETEEQIFHTLEKLCSRVDVIVLSDYGQGILTGHLLDRISRLQKRKPCVLVADTRRLDEYRGLRLAAIRPSYQNAVDLQGRHQNGEGPADPLETLNEVGERILETLDTQMVTITLDDNGALVLDRGTPVYRTYAPRMPFNLVSGAGDAFISGLALSLAAGAQAAAAGEIASAVASIVVQKDGLAACCMDELKAYLGGDLKLVEDWAALSEQLSSLRQQGRKIVFTNGVFDLLHSAHVTYLNQAKSFGDILVIGVNSDESVKRLKGENRPINSLIERMRVLSGLSCVDFVTSFGEDNPIDLIHFVRPDVFVKGGDYTRATLPEAEVVEGYGGRLQIVPYIAHHSTTGVIERIRTLYVSK